MKIKIKTLILLMMCTLMILTVSCQSAKTPGTPDTPDGQDSPAAMTDTNGVADTKEMVTPTQFLCYRLGNVSEYSVSYEIGTNDEKRTFVHYCKDGMTALYFNAADINGVSVNVREIEKDGRVFYVMDEKKKVISYKAPASDILLNELQKICLDGEYEIQQEDGKTVFEYRVPYQQDESITSAYRFFMEQGVLKELDILYDLSVPANANHCCFSEFKTEPVSDEVFEIPQEFEATEYDVCLFGDEIPPWFE